MTSWFVFPGTYSPSLPHNSLAPQTHTHTQSSLEFLYLIRILPHVQLSLDLSEGSVSLRQAVGSLRRVRVVRRDLRPLREEVVAAVVQPVIRVGADHVGGAAVRVVGGVALFAVRHRQVLRAEGRHRLALGDAGRTPGGHREMTERVRKEKKKLGDGTL